MSHHIAILFHESDRASDISRYAVSALADTWRRDGHTITNLFGIRKFIPADLILVHVDLSVVPDEYITFAEQYPIVLNSRAKDIRKSTFSPYLLRQDDPYAGPVIIKSDMNYAGIPDAARLWKYPLFGSSAGYYAAKALKILRHVFTSDTFRLPADYLVVESLRKVPEKWFKRNDIVIQRFCPECEGGLYHTRFYNFLGDHNDCRRLSSPDPVVNACSAVGSEPVEVHPEIEKIRRDLKFDYGKFDYVMHEGAPILLDINKTTGASKRITPELQAMRRHRAEGLYGYFR